MCESVVRTLGEVLNRLRAQVMCESIVTTLGEVLNRLTEHKLQKARMRNRTTLKLRISPEKTLQRVKRKEGLRTWKQNFPTPHPQFQNGGRRCCWWVKARDAAKHHTTHRTQFTPPHQTKNYPAPNAHSATVRKA